MLHVLEMMMMVRGSSDPASEIGFVTHDLISTHATLSLSLISFVSDGSIIEITTDGSPSPAIGSDEWHVDQPSATGADWEIMATLTGGTTPTSNDGLDTWLRLDATRSWGNISAGPLLTSTLTFDFGLQGTSSSLVQVTGVQLSADQVP